MNVDRRLPALLVALVLGSGSIALGAPPSEGRRRGPPPEALAACAEAGEGDACAFDAPFGRLEGQCRVVPGGSLACVPAGHRPPPPRDED